jgi:PIN domain nuclease of toxin-antitoxin system
MPFVTDTHALVWHVTGDAKLSRKAKAVFDQADGAQEVIFVPCIALYEILALVEKKRIEVDFGAFLRRLQAASHYRIEPICAPVIQACLKIPRDKVRDPSDRLIAATSLHLGFPLITRDDLLRHLYLDGFNVLW